MDKIPGITVKIMQGDEIHFYLHGNFSCDGSIKGLNGAYVAKINGSQIAIKSEKFVYISENEIVFKPEIPDSSAFELKDVVIGIDFHWEQKEDQQFRGELMLKMSGNNLLAINKLDVETYLTSVISSEMKADSSLELLKAHAVVSRSWLFAQLEKQSKIGFEPTTKTLKGKDEIVRWYDREDHDEFNVCADDHCQRYQGITRAYNPNVVEAINKTFGLVLMSEGKVCDTRYSKCCGGVSESFENVWEPIVHPYLRHIADIPAGKKGYPDLRNDTSAAEWILTKPESFCNTSDKEILKQVLNDYDQQSENFFRWKIEYEQNELKDLIKRKSGIDIGEIIDLQPVERGFSARIIKLRIVGTRKTLIVGKELEIRKWLSPSHLYSSAFLVERKSLKDEIPGKFILYGAGWGHGVGLCQIGAAVMGHQGYPFESILKHYFIDTVLVKKY